MGKIYSIFMTILAILTIFAGNVWATAPASLGDALAVSVDNAAMWSCMKIMLGIAASIFLFKVVKHFFGSR